MNLLTRAVTFTPLIYLFFVPPQRHRAESLQTEPRSRTAVRFLALSLAQSISVSVFALGFMNVKMVHSCHSR